LRRGHILLIAGGVAVAASLSVLGYYGLRLVETLGSGEKYMVEPNKSIQIMENITSSGQGAYLAMFPDFTGGKPGIIIRDPADRMVLQKSVDPPLVLEPFAVAEAGVYTLTPV
jgi:hypothetical protein